MFRFLGKRFLIKEHQESKKVFCNPLESNKIEDTAVLSLQGRIGAVKTTQPFNEPLYFIDEKISANSDFARLNSNHIKSIKVLKGEEATKLYGEKGSNGAILITTKNKQ